jgi:hypothetical protein
MVLLLIIFPTSGIFQELIPAQAIKWKIFQNLYGVLKYKTTRMQLDLAGGQGSTHRMR